ncbi:MAG TPA: WecB/TagA/CpsF family glycosyltransferase [Candidatus Binatia bacterium]
MSAPNAISPATREARAPELATIPPESLWICGVRIENLTKTDACNRLRALIERRTAPPRTVYIVNAHTINLACDRPAFRDVLNGADAVWGDGTGVRWAARRKGVRMRDNLVGTDLVPLFMSTAAGKRYRYFLFGGHEPVVRTAAAHVATTFGVTMAGHAHGHFEPSDNDAVIERINASRADVLLVAMGNPVQEQWIHDNRAALRVQLCIGIGGLVDHWGGALDRAPRWIRDRGFEWAHILMRQPHKWRRYVLGNPKFVLRVLRDSRSHR